MNNDLSWEPMIKTTLESNGMLNFCLEEYPNKIPLVHFFYKIYYIRDWPIIFTKRLSRTSILIIQIGSRLQKLINRDLTWFNDRSWTTSQYTER